MDGEQEGVSRGRPRVEGASGGTVVLCGGGGGVGTETLWKWYRGVAETVQWWYRRSSFVVL